MCIRDSPETEPDGLLAALDPAAEAMLREDQRVLWRAVSSLSERCQALLRIIAFIAVSYTHLDVYKRQAVPRTG